MTRRRVAITGIGIVSALGADAGSDMGADARRRLRHRAGVRVRRHRLSQPDRRRSGGRAAGRRMFSPLQWRRWSRSDRLGVVAADEALAGCRACSIPASISTRVGVMLGAGHRRSDSQRRLFLHDAHRRHRAGAAVEGVESLLQHARRRHRASPRLRRPARRASSPPARRARSRSARPRMRFGWAVSMRRSPAAPTRSRG